MDDDRWTEEQPWLGQYILDENGNAVPATGLLSWGKWLEDHHAECNLAKSRIGDISVSTIFLGIDYGALWMRECELFDPATYKPKLWENDGIRRPLLGGLYDLHQTRYTSKEDALEGHKKIVQMLTS